MTPPDVSPFGLAVTPSGHVLCSTRSGPSLLAVTPHGKTRRITAGFTVRSTDGPASSAGFYQAKGLCLSLKEQCMYVVDSGNNRIRRVALPPALFVPAPPAAPDSSSTCSLQ